MSPILSPSYLNDQKHPKKSERFEVVQPSMLGAILQDHGFDLIHLKTSRSKKPENSNFQTTVSRYRSRQALNIEGLSLDIIIKAPHIYGSIETVLGLFRGICSNQLTAGTRFESFKFKHMGNPLEQLNRTIPLLVNQQSQLETTIEKLKNKTLSIHDAFEFAKLAALIRLGGRENIESIILKSLLTTRRVEDRSLDMFSVYNVVQENIQRYGISYFSRDLQPDSSTKIVAHKLRRMHDNSAISIDFNRQLFDLACNFAEIEA